jgi:hypothetical protein
MKTSALALKRKQWEPFAFASPSLVLILLVIVLPLALPLTYSDRRVPSTRAFVLSTLSSRPSPASPMASLSP